MPTLKGVSYNLYPAITPLTPLDVETQQNRFLKRVFLNSFDIQVYIL
jgi:hypothetical protein